VGTYQLVLLNVLTALWVFASTATALAVGIHVNIVAECARSNSDWSLAATYDALVPKGVTGASVEPESLNFDSDEQGNGRMIHKSHSASVQRTVTISPIGSSREYEFGVIPLFQRVRLWK